MRRTLFLLACLTLTGCQTAAPAAKAVYLSADGSVRAADHAGGMSEGAMIALADRAALEYQQLRVLFATDAGRLTVNVRPDGLGRHFPPAAIRIPAETVCKGTAITAHEIAHLLTQGWASAVLKEGLAVYAQDRVGGQRSWPNYRRGIHRLAHELTTAPDSPAAGPAAAESVFATAKAGETLRRRTAYTVAGSWVTWLINQRFGGDVERFVRTLYRSGDYRRAAGVDISELETAWRRFIAGRAAGS